MPTQAAETPHEKFDRLAEARLYQVEEAIRKLANLANAYIYEYSEVDKKSVFDRVLNALDVAEQKFDEGLRKAERLRGKRDEDDGATQVGTYRKRRQG